MTKLQLFERVVENALDFLHRALAEFPNHPKYSVISFHAAVELFLKARLMSEHWSLVVTKQQEADWDRFVSGDFRSVSLNEAANKLKKVVQSGLVDEEFHAFDDVTKHRNRMVHFVHEVTDVQKKKQVVGEVAKTQLKAWYFLHRLLTKRWRDVFEGWSGDIETIDVELRKHREFLAVIFEDIKDQIQGRRDKGVIFRLCPSCSFEAQEHAGTCGEIYEAECLVCGLSERNLRIRCASCGATVYFANEGFATCQACGTEFGPKDVVRELWDSDQAAWASHDGDDTWELGNCGYCDGWSTVVPIDEDRYVCAGCFEQIDEVGRCGWCNEINTADMEFSYLSGCNHCQGWFGEHADD